MLSKMKSIRTSTGCLAFRWFLIICFIPLQGFSQLTMSCDPFGTTYGTGYCTPSVKVDGNIQISAQETGWAVFDISSLPTTKQISAINIDFQVMGSLGAGNTFRIKSLTVNPMTAVASSLFSVIWAGVDYSTPQSCNSTGLLTVSLNAMAISELQDLFTSGADSFRIGVYTSAGLPANAIFVGNTSNPVLQVTFCSTMVGNTSISSSQPVCPGTIEYFSANSANATMYQWVVPPDWSIISGQGTYHITAMTSNNSGFIKVMPSNAFCTGEYDSVWINVVDLNAPSIISGPDTVCAGSSQMYMMSSADATGCLWGIPPGWSIQSTSLFYLNVVCGSNSGYIYVIPETNCGYGVKDSLYVHVDALPGTAVITGPNWACEGDTVTLTASSINAQTYTWTIPATWTVLSVQGSPTITFVVDSTSGFPSVQPSNINCQAFPSYHTVNVQPFPIITLSPAFDTCCLTWPSFMLTMGHPTGGTYSGTGVNAATSQFHPAVADTGTHLITYTYIVTSSCSDIDTISMYVGTCTGLDETKGEQNILLFPNPGNGWVTLKPRTQCDDVFQIRVYNPLGVIIFEQKEVRYTKGDNIIVDTGIRTPGVYFLRLSGMKNSFTSSFTVN